MIKIRNYLFERFTDSLTTVREQYRVGIAIKTVLLLQIIAIAWGVLYLVLGHPLVSIPPALYVLISFLSMFITAKFNAYFTFVTVHIALMILAPFSVHLLLGTIHDASLVIVWVIMPSIAAIFLLRRRAIMIMWGMISILTISLTYFLRNIYPNLHIHHHDKTSFLPYTFGMFMNFLIIPLMFITLLMESRRRTYEIEDHIKHILYDSYPHPIAQQIFSNNNAVIETTEHHNVSIIFIKFTPRDFHDNKNYDQFSRSLPIVFKTLDYSAEKLGIYKIKTESETYIAGTGIFDTNNLEQLLKLALIVSAIIRRINRKFHTDIQYQIGINTGNLIGGIVGKTKKIYDVWGDTVNIASRMANTSHVNKIIVSQDVHDKIKNKYHMTPYHDTEIKGKGTATIYSIDRKYETF